MRFLHPQTWSFITLATQQLGRWKFTNILIYWYPIYIPSFIRIHPSIRDLWPRTCPGYPLHKGHKFHVGSWCHEFLVATKDFSSKTSPSCTLPVSRVWAKSECMQVPSQTIPIMPLWSFLSFFGNFEFRAHIWSDDDAMEHSLCCSALNGQSNKVI
jgi:hypothetical protein